MEISADYLFHFTNDIKHIENIMINGFKPFYCMEKLSYISVNGEYLEFAFPLVSFCDLPISLQKQHRKRFGGYGIGLNKSWGNTNHLTPIVYTSEKAFTSGILNNFIDLYEMFYSYIEKQKQTNKTLQGNSNNMLQGFNNNISYLMMCFKPYEGHRYLKEEKRFDENKSRFYDEREWRYLPIKVNGLKLSLSKDQYEDSKTLYEENLMIQKNNHLKFSLDDLDSIYLKEESEKSSLLKKLSRKYNSSELSIIENKINIDN